jgi:myo-inositol 2-dehydrogenase / D-chiro-inositol 1-dehydrogenase
MDIRVAVIGCGRMGRQRARSALGLGARLVAVCDPDVARAREVAALGSDSRILAEWRDLNLASIDAVFVCTPPNLRGPVEIQAIEAGVAVFAEKPIGCSSEQAAAIVDAVQRKPVLTAVGYMNRYRPSVQAARDALGGKAVLGLSANWAGGRYGVPWWDREDLSGGPVNEQATHLVDLARYLVGGVREVHAMTAGPAGPHGAPETAAVSLRFDRDVLGTVLYTCQARQKAIDLHVFTEDHRVSLEGWDFRLRGADGRLFPEGEQDRNEIFDLEVAAFFDAIRKSSAAPILADFSDALRTQQTVDAIRRSLGSRRIERVD